MKYGLLIALGSLAGMAGIFVDLFICGFIQFLHEVRGKSIPDTNRLFIVLIFPLWAVIWFISYYVSNKYL